MYLRFIEEDTRFRKDDSKRHEAEESGHCEPSKNHTLFCLVQVVAIILERAFLIKALSVSRATVERAVAALIVIGKIEHRGSKKTGGYYVVSGKESDTSSVPETPT